MERKLILSPCGTSLLTNWKTLFEDDIEPKGSVFSCPPFQPLAQPYEKPGGIVGHMVDRQSRFCLEAGKQTVFGPENYTLVPLKEAIK